MNVISDGVSRRWLDTGNILEEIKYMHMTQLWGSKLSLVMLNSIKACPNNLNLISRGTLCVIDFMCTKTLGTVDANGCALTHLSK